MKKRMMKQQEEEEEEEVKWRGIMDVGEVGRGEDKWGWGGAKDEDDRADRGTESDREGGAEEVEAVDEKEKKRIMGMR